MNAVNASQQTCEKPACVRSFAITHSKGRMLEGTITIQEEGRNTYSYNWKVIPLGNGQYKVIGDGAMLSCEKRVPNFEMFPFSTDAYINNTLRQYILARVGLRRESKARLVSLPFRPPAPFLPLKN